MYYSSTDTIKHYARWLGIALPLSIPLGPAVGDVLLSLLGLVFLYHCTQTQQWQWLKQGWVVCMLVLWGWMILRAGFTEKPAYTMPRAFLFIRFPLCAAALIYWLLPDTTTRKYILTSLCICVIFLLADTLLQYVTGVDIRGLPPQTDGMGTIRLSGPFTMPKVGIILAWIGIPVLGALWHYQCKPHWIALYIIAYGAIVYLTGERMALLLLLFGLGLMALISCIVHKHLRKMLVGIIAIKLTIIASISLLDPRIFERQMASTISTIQHWQSSPYGTIWASATNMVAESPIAGYGMRQYRYYCPDMIYDEKRPTLIECNLHPHHLYIEWLVEGGVIALVLFVGMLFLAIKQRLRYGGFDILSITCLIALLLRIWPLSTATSFFVTWSALAFWLIFALALMPPLAASTLAPHSAKES